MKVHYINILLFAHALNILVSSPQNPSITLHTPKIPTIRSLCECELYAPANYDNDPQMKKVMQQFEDRTSQRLRDYDERVQGKRKQCKERCDKESQKIILKDKLEKELMDKFATLDTDIQSDAIPTCICEKSIADKVEKNCLKCGGILGTAMPELGAIGGSFIYSAAQSAAVKVGVSRAIELMGNIFYLDKVSAINLKQLITPANFKCPNALVAVVNNVNNMCGVDGAAGDSFFCAFQISLGERKFVPLISTKAGDAAMKAGEAANAEFAQMTSAGTIFSDAFVISAIVAVTIAVILLIIYLILRYRRKKKMKKKLQYIKVLEE